MQSFEECLLQYRHTLRRLLFEAGIPSNPGVTDNWVLEQVSTVMKSAVGLFVTDKPQIAKLKRRISQIFDAKGIRSFTPPLSQPGHVFLHELRDIECLSFVRAHFGKPVEDGIVIYPCGFGEWKAIKLAVEEYKTAITQQGMECEILLIEHPWNFAAYVFVPFQ